MYSVFLNRLGCREKASSEAAFKNLNEQSKAYERCNTFATHLQHINNTYLKEKSKAHVRCKVLWIFSKASADFDT